MLLAEYLRYSSDNQKCESIEEQSREIAEWAKRNDHQVIATYADSALSGKYDYRPKFEKMISDSKSCNWEAVIVFDSSRFSRGGEYGIIDVLRLQENGKTLLSVTESFTNDFAGKLVKHVKFLMNEEKLNQLSLDVKRGLKDNALKCKHNGGTPPLGYSVDENGFLIINEYEALAVKLIFNMFANHSSYTDICNELNSRGYKTKRNTTTFGKNSLHEILKNKKYIGIYEFGKITRKKLINRNNGQKSQTIENPSPIIIENGCPSIIDMTLWNRVQTTKQKHDQCHPAAKVEYKLKGKIICGLCGSPYCGSTMGVNKYPFYICNNKKGHKTCNNRNVKLSRIEDAVVEQIRNIFFLDIGFNIFKKYITEYNSRCETVDHKEVKDYENKVKVLESRLARAKEAYLNNVMDIDEFRKIKIENEKAHKILIAPFYDKRLNINDEMLSNIISNLEVDLLSDKEIINSFIEKIVVTGEDIDVYLYNNFLFEFLNDSNIKKN